MKRKGINKINTKNNFYKKNSYLTFLFFDIYIY